MHPGRAITPYQVAELLDSAYGKCASVGVASKAFAAVGIWPLNRNVFTSSDFVGSLVTDRPQPCVPAESGESSSTAAADLVGSTPTTLGPATVGNSESSSLQEPSVAAENGESSATVALDNYCTQAVSDSITTVGQGTDDGITTPVSNVCSMSISVSTIPAAVENC